MKKILFLGTTSLSYQVLSEIIKSKKIEISGIVTGEAHFNISYSKEPVKNYNFSDLSVLGASSNIPTFIMRHGMKDPLLSDWISGLDFDYILVVGWYHMIPKSWILDFKCLGIHASLLPYYRGGAPLVWALLNGETETGVSLFNMDNGVDTGPVIAQSRIPISEDETIASLLKKVSVETVNLCLEVLPGFEILPEYSQRVRESGSIFPQRKPEDGRIDPNISVLGLSRSIRAQTRPYPGAYLEKKGKKLYLWNCAQSFLSEKSLNLGELVQLDNAIGVQCTDGILVVTEYSLLADNIEIFDSNQIKKIWSI